MAQPPHLFPNPCLPDVFANRGLPDIPRMIPPGCKKGLDSEDADRRDSMTPQIFSSFCRADEKLYNKPIFFLAKWQDQKSVISKHNHAHVKYNLKMLKSESISVRIQKKRKRCAAEVCARGIKNLPK